LEFASEAMRELRIHCVLPVRVTWTENGRTIKLAACAVDVSQKGARLTGVTALTAPGQVVAIRRNTDEARFRVVWIGRPQSPQEGHVGVECVEDKIVWDSKPSGAQATHHSCLGKVVAWPEESESGGFEAKLLAIGLFVCETEGTIGFRGPLLLDIHTEETRVTVKGIAQETEQEGRSRVNFTHIRRGDQRELRELVSRLSRSRPSAQSS
jgi:hypothetical protein